MSEFVSSFFSMSLNCLLKKENLEIFYETEGNQETVHFSSLNPNLTLPVCKSLHLDV